MPKAATVYVKQFLFQCYWRIWTWALRHVHSCVVPQSGYHLANNPAPRLASLPLVAEAATLEELQECYVYQFIVYIYYFEKSAGQGRASMPIVQEMLESGMILFMSCFEGFWLRLLPVFAPYIVSTGPPTGVQIKVPSSTSLLISWRPQNCLNVMGRS